MCLSGFFSRFISIWNYTGRDTVETVSRLFYDAQPTSMMRTAPL